MVFSRGSQPACHEPFLLHQCFLATWKQGIADNQCEAVFDDTTFVGWQAGNQ